ncbi:hypothetical protein L861_16690 [Litchfieldella anticariensis FP35 = DSM 16096]|uniref:Uncharacterized protein n=1 Tax=Litchfieldella anticariensis (strain DSM 16096 / CECT 5854 / CIP 108499 / LMG 22089 / FP35) TaxID=1121939 RepID=S2KM23_LITA3|nr:hypothetical protein L861_16690 [Halomonas anticariensis FP35 = DSM 16096]
MGGVDVTITNEDRIGIHGVHLHRNPLRPGRPELRDRYAGMEEKRRCAQHQVLVMSLFLIVVFKEFRSC